MCGNQLEHARDYRIDGHRSGIYDPGVVGGPEWSNRAACVAPIALGDLQRKGGEVSTGGLVFQLVIQLVITAARPLFGAGCQKNLKPRGRENDGSHIAAVGNQPRRPCKGTLALQQSRPDRRHGCDARGTIARLLGTNGLADLCSFQPNLLMTLAVDAESDIQLLGDPRIGRLVRQSDAF